VKHMIDTVCFECSKLQQAAVKVSLQLSGICKRKSFVYTVGTISTRILQTSTCDRIAVNEMTLLPQLLRLSAGHLCKLLTLIAILFNLFHFRERASLCQYVSAHVWNNGKYHRTPIKLIFELHILY
jgi:hypothetical protein